MKHNREATPRHLITSCVIFSLIVISNSFVVLFSPFMFVKVLTLIGIIVPSIVIGTFVREILILREKKSF
ncbi:hypothetical protein [Bacillus sp. CGMCC 1.16541]|uniref:hypothetical protein n=1 Tax=Bacillus sp. CGMCC 1.16541 TaxID=2185143 RepID=UPI000D72AF11|nr:hypothetical protein [Bacillus sp. CGMCC 1.16541]